MTQSSEKSLFSHLLTLQSLSSSSGTGLGQQRPGRGACHPCGGFPPVGSELREDQAPDGPAPSATGTGSASQRAGKLQEGVSPFPGGEEGGPAEALRKSPSVPTLHVFQKRCLRERPAVLRDPAPWGVPRRTGPGKGSRQGPSTWKDGACLPPQGQPISDSRTKDLYASLGCGGQP